ncbi:uncharacterized protein LOC133834477 [Humulus lupulus]|uniref:uncharacterized protein LOC133834477 n=1 Tax=Humulus lupulus TaxID=3486 RepID=UPI002B4136C3|nr:uncharacterized protein LOC133834477 [Humulus lupulus]
MPNYVKFLKDILTKKKRLGKFETVSLTEGCSAILKNKIPPKLKDPGSFTIPISIGGQEVGKALCDLGDSLNLMPMSIFKKLGIGEARPTTLTLQLADRSMVHPEGKIEGVLVQVDKFIFPADFIILDYEEERDLIEKMHEKHNKGVKKNAPFEEIEKGGEPWISKEEEPSHLPKLPKKKKKKKKHSRNP